MMNAFMMLSKASVAAVLLAVLNTVPCYSVISGDLIKSLPGWSGPLPSPQYSGYIKLNPTSGKYFHYWFVLSEKDPKNDPVVLWLNGGPGCSSLLGYFTEQGPLHFNNTRAPNSTIPSLIRNPYSWTKISNMIFLESPVGVGLSYSTTPKKDYTMDDFQTAVDNYNFLINFFDKYSEFKENDFYIAGESYGGIYIPMLADNIRIMNKVVPPQQKINLKALMIGNGCVGNAVGSCAFDGNYYIFSLKIHAEFYHGHGLFPDDLYDKLSETCDFTDSNQSMYRPHLQDAGFNRKNQRLQYLWYMYGVHRWGNDNTSSYIGPQGCEDEANFDSYLNNPLVRTAIHVKPVSQIGKWTLISRNINYIKTASSVISLYPILIQEYRTLIYNGDVDGCVPFIGDLQWTSSLGLNIKEPWHPWLVDNQVAGYVTKYDVNDFMFLTVKGAGHMVPQYKPKQAYAMFERFIKQEL